MRSMTLNHVRLVRQPDHNDGAADLELIMVALIYLLLLVAVWALYRPGPPKVLKAISVFGICLDVMIYRRGLAWMTMSTFGGDTSDSPHT